MKNVKTKGITRLCNRSEKTKYPWINFVVRIVYITNSFKRNDKFWIDILLGR